MQNIVSKGKDINEAIILGLEIMETTKDKVNIEIMQHDEKGFLGFGVKSAIVKLTRNNLVHSTVNMEEIIDRVFDRTFEEEKVDLDPAKNQKADFIQNDTDGLIGKVWIKDGKLCSKSSPNHFPTVTIQPGIKLYKNNQLVEKTTVISELDVYDIKVDDEEIETNWKISMDQHKLHVQLQISPGYRILRTIADIDADDHIELRCLETKEIHHTLTIADVVQKLEELGVNYGIKKIEILKALQALEPSTFEIATGMKSKQGKDGWIELKVDMDFQEGLREREDGRVDFREIKTIPKVERGKLIAVIHPPIRGEAGFTVTNETLTPKQTLPIVLNTGSGVVLLDDKIVSTASGRPHIEQRGQRVKVSIITKLMHNGNVNLTSGNIRFIGDVEIIGEVEEKMVVEAEGDILVHRTVNGATMTSSGSIISYGNIIGSEISAGKSNMLVTELGHLLGIINQNTVKIIAVIKQLTISPAFKSGDFSRGGLQPLIRILLEQKFKNFPPLVKKYIDAVRKGDDFLEDDVWRRVAVSLSQVFLSLTNGITSLERIIQLSDEMKGLHELSQIPVEPNSYITIPNALGSKLYCSGNILILGQGCVNTKVHAGGMLKISGILRGGEVYGRLGVEINEVGAESGTATTIVVPSDARILINKVMEGTTIKVGMAKHTFKETRHHIDARLDENEQLIFG